MANILILGGNFGGATAAFELARKLGKGHAITVVSPSSSFLYVPSLIWVPFGKRKVKDITFDVGKRFEKKGIHFLKDRAIRILPESRQVETDNNGTLSYDYLVVATGCNLKTDAVPGLEPSQGLAECIVTPPMAEKAYAAFQELVKDPGPVVVGASQGASCMGAAYEYLFNMDKQLRKAGVRKKVRLTWITPEPFLGHFGIGGIRGGEGMLKIFMKMYGIDWRTDSSIKEIREGEIELNSGEVLPAKLKMIMPPFVGARVVRDSEGLADEKGFIPTDDSYRHVKYPEIFAAGLAVQVKPPFENMTTPFGVPKTGFPTDVQAKIAAHNIAAEIKGKGKVKREAFGKIPGICVMDAGSKEVWILTNHLFKPRQVEIMMPNILGSFLKTILEKYMIVKNRLGWSFLP